MTCRECGLDLDVPRLRDLAAFADDRDHVGTPSSWDPARGMAFAGCAVAALAALAAAVADPVGTLLVDRTPQPPAIRRNVDAAPIASVHEAFTEAARVGLNRPPSTEEIRLQQFSRLVRSLATVLWGVAAAGVVVASVGLVIRSARGSGGNHRP